jgi:hypothetical protein
VREGKVFFSLFLREGESEELGVGGEGEASDGEQAKRKRRTSFELEARKASKLQGHTTPPPFEQEALLPSNKEKKLTFLFSSSLPSTPTSSIKKMLSTAATIP